MTRLWLAVLTPLFSFITILQWEGWISAFWGYYGIRIVADYLKKRLYWKTGQVKIHLHHFLFAFPLLALGIILYEAQAVLFARLIIGFVTGLFASETRELITQEWQK